jgi:hypothetical protein
MTTARGILQMVFAAGRGKGYRLPTAVIAAGLREAEIPGQDPRIGADTPPNFERSYRDQNQRWPFQSYCLAGIGLKVDPDVGIAKDHITESAAPPLPHPVKPSAGWRYYSRLYREDSIRADDVAQPRICGMKRRRSQNADL